MRQSSAKGRKERCLEEGLQNDKHVNEAVFLTPLPENAPVSSREEVKRMPNPGLILGLLFLLAGLVLLYLSHYL